MSEIRDIAEDLANKSYSTDKYSEVDEYINEAIEKLENVIDKRSKSK